MPGRVRSVASPSWCRTGEAVQRCERWRWQREARSKITAKEENFRTEPMQGVRPGISVSRRDPVEPVPVGTIVAMVFRVTGYDQDCDGSLMARFQHITRDGDATGWEPDRLGIHPDTSVMLDEPDELHRIAETK
jgi:hypothetical protein